jgi:hypothetical protein
MITIIKSCTRSKANRTSIGKRVSAWFHGSTLTRDLSVIVVIKFGLLMILKYIFFNHPQAENMTMPPAEVARQVLSLSPAIPSEPKGNHHAQ